MKYTDAEVTFREFPDEISLCINISNCKHHCKGCHSPELWKDVGNWLDGRSLSRLIESNKGITCVGFMGGDYNPSMITTLAAIVKNNYKLKVGWYSGEEEISPDILLTWFDYIKIGPYIEEKGPLNNPNTNQRMYQIIKLKEKIIKEDITYKFWNNEKQN